MSKLTINYAEFYITNVCNLSCPGCNRFNDYDFTGFQKWEDYKDIYEKWAEELKIGHFAILGGEPLLNPTFMDWATGLRSLWPKQFMRIISNGFQLNKIKHFYQFLNDHSQNTELWVGIHNEEHKTEIMEKIENFLAGPLTYVHNDDDIYHQYMTVTDSNNVRIRVEFNWWFHQGAIIKNSDSNKLSLHQSNPKKAHDLCHMKDCHHFIRGKLYKCGVVAVLPEFDKQFNLDLTIEDKHLLTSYVPLSVTDPLDAKSKFINNLSNTIDQCKFCPEEYHGDQIYSVEKKHIKIHKLHD